ncbi:MAG: hypothetical protein U0U69_00310 [Acidimicrobiia bacterium]
MRRVLALVAVLALVVAACGGGADRVSDYELSSYTPHASQRDYRVLIRVSGTVDLGKLGPFAGGGTSGGDGSGSGTTLSFSLNADGTGTVVERSGGFQYTLELTDIDARLPFGAKWPTSQETLTQTVQSDGKVTDTNGGGILTSLPALLQGIAWNCPQLPGAALVSGSSWESAAPLAWAADDVSVKQRNQWEDTDVDGTQAAMISSQADDTFAYDTGIDQITKLLGFDSPLLDGVGASLSGSVKGNSHCALSIPDQDLLETGSNQEVSVDIKLTGGGLASLAGTLHLDATIEESMTPR